MRVLTIVLMMMVAASTGAAAENLSIKAFFGHFVGRGTASSAAGGYFDISNRDLDVTIKAAGTGVEIAWSTYIRKTGDGNGQEVVKRSTKVTFRATGEPNVFIEKRGIDPFDGTPLSWARVEGRTLSTFTFVVDKNGIYSLASYTRTLDKAGRVMDLRFEARRNGEVVRSAGAKLVRK